MVAEPVNFTEILVTPFGHMIRQIGEAIAAAQGALDAGAIERQALLGQEHPELEEIGYQVTWYQMPEVTVELKVAVHYEQKGEDANKGRLFLSPFNAKYKSAFTYTADGASTLKLRIVPIPPPAVTGA